ncbi:Flp pilus assembly protein CpaB [Cognatishimia maritima]|uniref:Pilus assembly protein CpaB n=1 Tax=Cognatishimia maritima TaxID=870908 RepID=A0A1M5NZQ7_9RHOB|nr:Flp pilus assembly protein CpaB [Cognatishimia maritima]SHG94978.1 pilus assembly protein CpaB [Cognatishimia maritima]
MRFSTVASLLVAVILAVIAVFGFQQWLEAERTNIQDDLERRLAREAQAEAEAPKNTIVVADRQLAFGHLIEGNVLQEIEWTSSVRPDGSFSKIEEIVVGDTEETRRFALTQIAQGEPILASKITVPGQRAKLSAALTPGLKAVSIRVNDVLGVAGFVLPGDRVDVMLTRGGRSNPYVDVLLQGVRVLAIDQVADERRDKPSVVRTVTFEVNTTEAQKLVLGANVGTLSLALRNVGSNDIENIERVTSRDLNEQDASDDLIRAQAEELALEAEQANEEARFSSLENLIQDLSEGVNQRLEGVEQKIEEQEPVIIAAPEPQIAPTPAPTVSLAPSRVNVSVIRNGKRVDYKVSRGDDAGEFSADDETGNDLSEAETQ